MILRLHSTGKTRHFRFKFSTPPPGGLEDGQMPMGCPVGMLKLRIDRLIIHNQLYTLSILIKTGTKFDL